MIEQLRNFIRHGKQANQKIQDKNTYEYEPKIPLTTDSNRIHPEKTKVDNSICAQIVAEEREQKNKLPKYPGLERYCLLDKMGEYVNFYLN